MLKKLDLAKQKVINRDIQANNIIAEGLLNPRGMCCLQDGSVLVTEAGTGIENDTFSGRIVQMRKNGGTFTSPEKIASGFRCLNMQQRMFRDEIMGLSDVVFGDGICLASLTDYVEESKIYDLSYTPPEPMFYSKGNINSLCFHPKRESWFAVKPDLDVLVEFKLGKEERVVSQLPKYPKGQDAVPVTLEYEGETGTLLVSLFSGEIFQNSELKGMDFENKVGKIIRVDPENGEIEELVTGLQFPTGMAQLSSHELLVLELCDGLLEPLLENWCGETLHGGYERFSGRLLYINTEKTEVKIFAEHLDLPSNLCLLPDNTVLISEGMGLSGRSIPKPDGSSENIVGRIRQVYLTDM